MTRSPAASGSPAHAARSLQTVAGLTTRQAVDLVGPEPGQDADGLLQVSGSPLAAYVHVTERRLKPPGTEEPRAAGSRLVNQDAAVPETALAGHGLLADGHVGPGDGLAGTEERFGEARIRGRRPSR